VTVTSEPGRGTAFHLHCPLGVDGPSVPAIEASAAIPSGQGQLVMLVDDDPSIIETVRKVLQRLGYAVSAYLRADEALGEFVTSPDRFGLVLSDLTMPGLNGLQFAAGIREVRPDFPLVLVSGYWSEADLVEAHRLRVSATLPKPLTYELIGRIMAEHVRRG
jgi:DNA-binding NtrC family response regulator